MKKYSLEERKRIVENINNLSKIEHEEIFKILLKHNLNFSKNSNGFFFNITSINDDIIDEVKNTVDFYHKNKKKLEEMDERLINCHYINKNIKNIENTFKEYEQFYKINESWQILLDKKNNTKIQHAIDDVISSKNKKNKKEFNDKYILSLKKYINFFNNNKKFDNENNSVLHKDKYTL